MTTIELRKPYMITYQMFLCTRDFEASIKIGEEEEVALHSFGDRD